MREAISIRARHYLPAIVTVAVAAVWLGGAGRVAAGIIAPQQIGFSADGLAQSLDEGAGASTSSSSPARHDSRRSPFFGGDQPSELDQLLASHLPTGSTSSSTSTSSGSFGSGAVVCLLSTKLDLRDDSPLGQLAEDHGLSLPDPPGTDLLRPPRA